MPTFEVRRTKPIMVSVTVEAGSEDEAIQRGLDLFIDDAGYVSSYEAKRQPPAPDDSGDARSEARYTETDTDAETERRADHRWGLGASESPAEGTEA